MSASNPHGIQPGQTVYYRPAKVILETTVISVGRKWAECATMRFGLKDMMTDSPIRSVKVYLTRYALVEADATGNAWLRLKGALNMRWTPPEGMTSTEILAFLERIERKHDPKI